MHEKPSSVYSLLKHIVHFLLISKILGNKRLKYAETTEFFYGGQYKYFAKIFMKRSI